jgi:hypothetical protein
MCGSEPCHSCQRLRDELAALKADYARDGIRDVVALVKAHEATKRELKAARATLAKVAAIVADPDAALVVDRVRAALEPTPKGTKP